MSEAIPMLDLQAQYRAIQGDIHAAIHRVLDSQHFILGPEVEALEAEIAVYSQCRFGVGVSSGTDALLLALMTLGVGPGDEVITSAYSFFATAGSIVRLGARPVFVDVELETMNMDASALEAKITPRTRAILPVHLCGQVAEMGEIMTIAERHRLPVIEDACQAIGAELNGRRAGSFGAMGCFSFFPSKNLGGAGDSGMVVCSDPQIADRLRLLRNHGHRPKYYNQAVGGNFRMDALQAAILRAKFPYLDGWTAARQRNAARYRAKFLERGLASESPGERDEKPVLLLRERPARRHIYHLFQIRARQRDGLMAHLKQRGIASEVYYPVPLPMQACFADMGYRAEEYPNAARLSRESLALPVYPELTEAQIERVVETIAEFYFQ